MINFGRSQKIYIFFSNLKINTLKLPLATLPNDNLATGSDDKTVKI